MYDFAQIKSLNFMYSLQNALPLTQSPLNAEGAAGHKARQQNHPTLEGLLVLAIMVVMLTNASFTSLGARE